ncbi:MAG: radical SAM family heme chaperone HemW [Anaerolineae bacterium]
MQFQPISLYAHIPFCSTLCTYCAFNTYAGMGHLIAPFTEALSHEMALVGQEAAGFRAHTLYLGGGTPSLLSPAQVEQIILAARRCFDLQEGAEITLEVNPGSTDLTRLHAYRSAGVNRLSIGVQSADEVELRLFGRRHSFADAHETFSLARAAGFASISLDLIYGAPLQTRRSWRATLKAVLAWEPDHLSLYSLTLEPGTSLTRRVARGRLPEPNPDLAAAMYHDAQELAGAAGLQQYEIANWARPGHESIHNRQYWLNRPYLGFGPGAHGSANRVRYWNIKPVPAYIERVTGGEPQPFPFSPALDDYERLDAALEMAETVILGLRLVREGMSRADFQQRFSQPVEVVYGPVIDSLQSAGLLEVTDQALRLTNRAYLISNRVFMEFLPG